MTTLPTFIELLASLGLDENRPNHSTRRHAPPGSLHSASSSSSSSMLESPVDARMSPPKEFPIGGPAIVIDAPECLKVRSLAASSRSRGARFTPYGSEVSGAYVRRSSITAMDMPTIHSLHGDESTARKLGSPPPSGSRLIARRRPSMANLTLDPDAAQSSTPISSLLRRRSPQPSPTTPGFRASRRSSVASGTASPSPLTPPSVPALPTLPPMPTNYTFGSPAGPRTMPSSEFRSPRRGDTPGSSNLDELQAQPSPLVFHKSHARSISAGSSNSSVSRRALKNSSKPS
ncbi:hypothetical protein FS749_000437 [Ceratobasidium sp. UAMH 11750]|nr:hypothetical protein FS749_000437 [Ceratobasidium sp. UAMH 11750]